MKFCKIQGRIKQQTRAFYAILILSFISCASAGQSIVRDNPGEENMQEIIRIDFGGVNAYLIKNKKGFYLIDAGFAGKEKKIEKVLEENGCGIGDLKLIIATHGDADHVGSCVYLHEKYNAPVLLHRNDLGMVEHDDMMWNRKEKPDIYAGMFRLMSVLTVFVKVEKLKTFTPDIIIDDECDLNKYGLDARILWTPGHSKGSISVLTAGNNLFCGDLIYNFFGTPRLYAIDNREDFEKSFELLKTLDIKTVFPGHGKSFAFDKFVYNQ